MSSLQEQLMKAGLASKQDVKMVKSEKRKKNKQKTKKGTVVYSELDQQIEQARLAKIEKDKALNLTLQQQAGVKADKAKIKQMIEANGLTDIRGELVFNFTYQGKVKKLTVDERARDALIKGRLGICVLGDDFYLLTDDTVRRIAALDPSVIAYLYDRAAEEQAPTIEADDPYADYQIPDDLMW